MNIEALRAMAEQDVSPNERDIARAKLEAMGAWPPPPRPPAPPSAAPAPEPWPGWTVRTTTTASANVTVSWGTNIAWDMRYGRSMR